MQDPANPPLILTERPDRATPIAALRRRWACGWLSFLPATELILLVIFTVSATLFLYADETDADLPSPVSQERFLASD